MQNLISIANKSSQKFQQKIQNRQFLLGKYHQPTCYQKCQSKKPIKFPKTKTSQLFNTTKEMYDQIMKKQKNKDKWIGKKDKKIQKREAKEKRRMLALNYEKYLPLNIFWNRYILSLMEQEKRSENREHIFLRADFHGALVTVLDSKTKSYIGIKGIIIKQTLKTFEIVENLPQMEQKSQQQIEQQVPTKKKSKIVFKGPCIFLFQIQDKHSFIVNGNSLVYRPSDRIRHKFKFKKLENMSLDFLEQLQQLRKEENILDKNNTV